MKTTLLLVVVLIVAVSLSAQNPTFTVFNQANTPVFTTNSFKQVAVGKGGHIWVGTNVAGIYKYDGTTWVKGNVLTNHNIRSITRGADSCIVVGESGGNGSQAINGGVDIFANPNFSDEHFGEWDGLSSRWVNGVCVTADGTIWTANGQDALGADFHEGGIGYMLNGGSHFDTIISGLPSSDIRVVNIACGNTEIWAGLDKACPSGCSTPAILRYSTYGAYLGKYDASNTPIPFAVSGGPVVRAICFTPNNVGWVGLHTGGLAVHQGANWYIINSSNSKFPNGAAVNTNSMKSDKSGRVYIGTTAGLLVYTGGSYTDPNSYQLYTTANGLPSNSITGIETYSQRTTWLTTTAGVVKMQDTFLPNPNGWQFPNDSTNIWPFSWYSQFDYSTDPFLARNNPFPKIDSAGTQITIPNSYFPDWPLFVEVVGENQCYNRIDNVRVLRQLAIDKFITILDEWEGSCHGFVQSSFMAWDSIQRFKARFPDVGPWTASNNLFNLPINAENRNCINYLMVEQSIRPYYQYMGSQADVTPNQLLASVKQMLDDNSKDDKGLILRNQNSGGGAHIVNPFRVDKDPIQSVIQYIRVYDNQDPDTYKTIIINTAQNYWLYSGMNWGNTSAHKGLSLSWPSSDWYNSTSLESVAKKHNPSLTPDIGTMEVYNPTLCDILISNTSGQNVGYTGGILIEQIPDALPIFRETSIQHAPKGYYLPESPYTIKLSNFSSASSYLKFFTNSNFFSYNRGGATISQKDMISIDTNGIFINNPDNTTKNINLKSVFDDSGNEMQVEVRNLGQSAYGSSGLQLFSTTEVKLLNTGSATNYDLKIHFVGSTGESMFTYDSISIAANTAHIISPDWLNLKTAMVKVFVDNGNNNSYEDTLYLGNIEPPNMLSEPGKLSKSVSASLDTIYIINSGGGVLNWTVSSSDTTWLKLPGGNSGTNSGSVTVSVLSNTGGARSGQLNFLSATNIPYTVKVTQEGVITVPNNVKASDGTFSNGIHISWSPVNGAVFYKVYRSDNAGDNGSAISNWIGDTTYVDTSCNKGIFYYYSIKAAEDSLGLDASDFSKKDDGWVAGITADFSYSGECSGQPTIFTETSTARQKTYFLWDFNNDGTIDTAGKIIRYIFPGQGTYSVKLTVTDSLNFTDNKVKFIIIKPFPSITMVSDTIICSNQSITLNAGNGFDNYLWSTGATTASISADSTGHGLGMAPFSVKVTVSNGCSAIATTRVTWDTCVSVGSFNLSGIASYDNSLSTVLNNVSVMLKQGGSTVYQTSSNALGNYSFANLQTGVYQLTGSSDKAWGGVNAADALKTMRHFVGLITLQGVRLHAADVNASGGINSADALLIAKRFVGLNTSFVVGDWAFAKDTVQIGSTTNQTANLKAVVYGDVDGSYIPPAKIDYGIELGNKGIIFADNSAELEIPVSISHELEIGAISLILNIPTQVADITNVTTNAQGTLLYHIEGEELRFAWYSLSPMQLHAGDNLLSIRCHLKPGAGSLPGKWTIDPQSQLADAKADAISNAKITIPDVVISAAQYYLGQNIPNPFSTTSDISWFMPEAGKVVLKVYDLLGNEVRTLVNAMYDAGLYTATLDASELQSGTYNYRIEISGRTNSFVKTKKLVLIK